MLINKLAIFYEPQVFEVLNYLWSNPQLFEETRKWKQQMIGPSQTPLPWF